MIQIFTVVYFFEKVNAYLLMDHIIKHMLIWRILCSHTADTCIFVQIFVFQYLVISFILFSYTCGSDQWTSVNIDLNKINTRENQISISSAISGTERYGQTLQ